MNRFRVALFIMVAVFITGIGNTFAQHTEDFPVNKLGAFLGKWKSSGEILDTAYSKASKNSAETDCHWSPNHGFLVCDQTVHTSAGVENDLSIYTYNDAEKSFSFFGLSRNDKNVRMPKLTIEGNIWTYSGGYDDGPKHITFRTVNEFKSPNLVIYRSECSDDGTHWIKTGSGTSTRIQ